MCPFLFVRRAIPAALISFSLVAAAVAQSVSVTTQHYDTNRTGANLNESILTTSNVSGGQFGKLFTRSVDGHIYAQPLYVPNVAIPNQGTHNVIYVATQHNSVYAFDADFPGQSTPFWQVNLGTSRPAGFPTKYGIESGIQVEIGITSTPVIDPTSGTLYAVAYTQDSSSGPYHYRLHALDYTTGAEKFGGPVEIQAKVSGTGDGSINGIITFDPKMHMQRPSLLLANGNVYLGFGSFADTDPYHGWVMAYNATTLAQVAVYNTSPDGGEGAIWMSGQGFPADSSGNLYFMVGNGSTTAESGGSSYGNAFLKLSDSNLSLLDWFMPFNATSLANADEDVGSSGPILIPGTTLITGGGKQGVLYLIDTTKMGHFNASGDTQIVQSFQASSDEIFNTPIYWNATSPLLFLWPDNQGLKAFSFSNGLFNTTPVAQNTTILPAQPGGTLALSANGNQSGTAIVWATHSTAGSAETVAQPGELHAYNASNIATELWNSLRNAARDDTGRYGKFNPPTVVNGKVYLGTFSEQLDIYGLLPLPVAPGQTLFTTQAPAVPNQTDNVSYELGTKFTSAVAGQITGIRYWKAASETGSHTGTIWSSTGTPLATVVFTNESASGWQQAIFATPLSIAAKTTYVVSVGTNSYYAATTSGLATSIVNGDVSTVADGNNGVYGALGTFPTNSSNSTSYFRDVMFQPTGGVSVFTTQTPTLTGQNDHTTYEMGMKFTADQPGEIAAIRFWKDAAETGTHVGHIWATNGGELADVTFTNETGSGWQTAYLSTPIYTTANAGYTVSVNANGYYVDTVNGLATEIVNGPLITIADGSNGVYGTIGTFPTTSSQSPNYFRDVVFLPNGSCSVPPAPTGLSSAPGISQVSLAWTTVAGATSYNVKRSTTSGSGYVTIATGITTTTYIDNNGGSGLTNGQTYYYVVSTSNPCGESANSTEVSATPEASFSGASLFSSLTPAASYTDGPYEMGVKVHSSQAGQIVSVSYYKVASETGAHTGKVWSASGQLLASAPFVNETGSGWQTTNLANPVRVTANVTYVISVNENTAYGAMNQGLAASISNGSLSSVADGNNGVYGTPGTFPTNSYQNTNYFRDLVFQANGSCSVPYAPTGLSAAPGIAQVSLAWTAASGATSYNVKRSTTSGSGYVTIATGIATTTYVDNGLTNGQTYYYVVSALNTCGESANSTEVSATPEASFSGSSLFSSLKPAGSYTDGPYEMGVKVHSTQGGQIVSVSYYKVAGESGAHTGKVWSASGQLLASAPFVNETGSGWQTTNLANPVQVTANITYVISVNENTAYGATNQGLATSISNGSLSSVADGNNGVYGTPGTFPTKSHQNSNYFRDLVFQANGSCSVPSAPTGLSAAPGIAQVSLAWAAASGATSYNVKRSTTSGSGYVTIATGVTTTTYVDNNGGSGLTNGQRYYYVVSASNTCGESANSAEVSATPEASFSGTSLFSSLTPAKSYTDGPYEMGVKVHSSRTGQIVSVSYYKVAGESGTHIGKVWSASGQLLASAPFVNETGSGWQTTNLANPVQVTANTTYVISVNENTAYGATNQGLASSISNGPLSSVADGNNGVYGTTGTFPTKSYQNSNYFRDLVFQ